MNDSRFVEEKAFSCSSWRRMACAIIVGIACVLTSIKLNAYKHGYGVSSLPSFNRSLFSEQVLDPPMVGLNLFIYLGRNLTCVHGHLR